MKGFFIGLRIRIKLLAAFGSILLLSVLLVILSIASINRVIHYKTANEKVDILKLQFETLDLASKEFIYEGYKSKSFLETKRASSVDMFAENYKRSKVIISELQLGQDQVSNQPIIVLGTVLDSLHNNFNKLVSVLEQRGFKDYGLEGELRTAIHKMENSEFEFDKISMLMLRRHEKDFFLRKDLKYQDEFNKRLDLFRQELETQNPKLATYLDDYKAKFNEVVAIEKKIGLNETEGIRGNIRKYFDLMRPQIEGIRESMKKNNEAQIRSTKWVLGIIFSIQIVAGIGMALIYANLLTKSIKEIRGGMQKLAAGIFPEKLRVMSTEEIGQTKTAFNQFIDRLKSATDFAEHLGMGELETKYDEAYSNDVLAKSLVNAQDKLRSTEERQRSINWANEGMAIFNNVIKNDAEDFNVLCDEILKFLIHYLEANQGALYIVRGSVLDGYLERVATYAYGKKKGVNEQVDIGTGLIGQCVLEGGSIYLTDVPESFVKITSGLGMALPRNILIVPLKIRELVIGVVELASFSVLQPYQIHFVEKIAENVASFISSKQIALDTKQLLKEAQEREMLFGTQETELQQSAEKLQMMQEELRRQRMSMEQEIKHLKEKLKTTVLEEQQS